jgi:hypothetical protein
MTTLVSLYRDINLLLDMIEAKVRQCKELYLEKITTEHNSTVGINAIESKPQEEKRPKEIVRCVSLPFGNYLSFT